MANARYENVVKLVSSYVGDAKGPGLVERQLKHCGSTPDTFSADDLKKIQSFIVGAAALYIPDPGKADEFGKKLLALAV